MRYFFLIYALIAIMVVGIFGFRGDKFSKPPVRIFPDMDEQDKLRAQKPSDFFSDGIGSRKPVPGTQPIGHDVAGAPEYGFGGQPNYYHTGAIDGFYGTGMPDELALTEENTEAFLRRGQERFTISCMPCHGASGDGAGITGQYGVPGIANLHLDNFKSEAYPDGRLYHVISQGKGLMSGYAYNISVRDRWAIVAYVRALQLASGAPLSDPKIKDAFEAATAAAK